METIIVSPWSRFFIPTFGIWASCGILAMMFHPVGYFGVCYAIASGLFWIPVAVCAFLRPRPSSVEVLLYRLGPVIMWAVVEVCYVYFRSHAA
jgi:ABC-type thiamin/hydroxymethylpyrimidine transport system permease subunit